MSNRPSTLDRVILSFPSLITLATAAEENAPHSSWIQLVRTGSFVSSRYGQFAITTDDLQMMAANFRPEVTPVDYDHLGQDPKRPLDGIAAGWLKDIALRQNGSQLWGLVAWTPEAATRIAANEYRFISPSFMKDYTTPTGEKVGTKLLGAALTNMPFLPEMAAVTLGSDAVFGQFALSAPSGSNVCPLPQAGQHLATIGQRVSFVDDAERTPELTAEERTQTFLVKSTMGEGDDQFVRLTQLDGSEFGWFRATQLIPAPAPQQAHEGLLLDRTQEDTMPQTDIEKLAAQFSVSVTRKFQDTRNWVHAFHLAQVEDERATGGKGAEAYRVAGMGSEMVDEEPVAPPLNLSTRSGETFDELATRYATEKGVSLREAVREVGRARPDLAAAR